MAATLITLATWYGWAGLAVAAVFLTWGIGRTDAAARDAWAFRPLLIPGVVLLWPLVLLRWLALIRDPNSTDGRAQLPPRRKQSRGELMLAVLVPLLLLAVLLLRATADPTVGNELLKPPAVSE